MIRYWTLNKQLLSIIEPLNTKSVNYFFIFVLKLGVIGAALGTTISYSIVMILSFYNLKYLKISVRFMKHLTWLLWLLIFNLPTLLVINLITDNILKMTKDRDK